MTVNFKNSAGTDLDNLFSVTNGNAGALGFKEAGGQDLGNRFASGSLGTNIGYKNNAGTDIGYLRGKVLAPAGSISLTRNNDNWGYQEGTICTTDSEGYIECYQDPAYCYANPNGEGNICYKVRNFTYIMYPKVSLTQGTPVTNIKYNFQFKRIDNSYGQIYVDETEVLAEYFTHNTWYTFYTLNTTSTSPSLNCKFRIRVAGLGEYHTRVVATITNQAGSITLTSGTLYTNEDS